MIVIFVYSASLLPISRIIFFFLFASSLDILRLCLFEDLFVEVLLAMFLNKLKDILIILVFNFVDLL